MTPLPTATPCGRWSCTTWTENHRSAMRNVLPGPPRTRAGRIWGWIDPVVTPAERPRCGSRCGASPGKAACSHGLVYRFPRGASWAGGRDARHRTAHKRTPPPSPAVRGRTGMKPRDRAHSRYWTGIGIVTSDATWWRTGRSTRTTGGRSHCRTSQTHGARPERLQQVHQPTTPRASSNEPAEQ